MSETKTERYERLRQTGGWIGVDLDATLAHYDGWPADGGVGEPILAMVQRVVKWRSAGIEVRIMTARVSGEEYRDVEPQRAKIQAWSLKHIGEVLPVTCTKDFQMIELWDDRAVQVVPNTGLRADGLAD
jgi:hypothetical protein